MASPYIPDRGDIVWLNFELTKGREIGKYRPALILSDRIYNQTKKLLICCAISTKIWDEITEVRINCLEQPSVVKTGLIQTKAWQDRNAEFITSVDDATYNEVLYRILPLIGADKLFQD